MSWTPRETNTLIVLAVVGWCLVLLAFWNSGGFVGQLIEWDIQPIRQRQHQVDINRATSRDFELLPGIGPVIARRIVESRNDHGAFKSVEDLDRVHGVGRKTIENLRDFLTINR